MNRYILTPTAQRDVVSIRDYYLEVAGPKIARQILVEFVEAFRFLSSTPGAGHRREDLAGDRPVLFWPMRDYLIVYRTQGTPLKVLSVVRGSRDVSEIIRRREL